MPAGDINDQLLLKKNSMSTFFNEKQDLLTVIGLPASKNNRSESTEISSLTSAAYLQKIEDEIYDVYHPFFTTILISN